MSRDWATKLASAASTDSLTVSRFRTSFSELDTNSIVPAPATFATPTNATSSILPQSPVENPTISPKIKARIGKVKVGGAPHRQLGFRKSSPSQISTNISHSSSKSDPGTFYQSPNTKPGNKALTMSTPRRTSSTSRGTTKNAIVGHVVELPNQHQRDYHLNKWRQPPSSDNKSKNQHSRDLGVSHDLFSQPESVVERNESPTAVSHSQSLFAYSDTPTRAHVNSLGKLLPVPRRHSKALINYDVDRPNNTLSSPVLPPLCTQSTNQNDHWQSDMQSSTPISSHIPYFSENVVSPRNPPPPPPHSKIPTATSSQETSLAQSKKEYDTPQHSLSTSSPRVSPSAITTIFTIPSGQEGQSLTNLSNEAGENRQYLCEQSQSSAYTQPGTPNLSTAKDSVVRQSDNTQYLSNILSNRTYEPRHLQSHVSHDLECNLTSSRKSTSAQGTCFQTPQHLEHPKSEDKSCHEKNLHECDILDFGEINHSSSQHKDTNRVSLMPRHEDPSAPPVIANVECRDGNNSLNEIDSSCAVAENKIHDSELFMSDLDQMQFLSRRWHASDLKVLNSEVTSMNADEPTQLSHSTAENTTKDCTSVSPSPNSAKNFEETPEETRVDNMSQRELSSEHLRKHACFHKRRLSIRQKKRSKSPEEIIDGYPPNQHAHQRPLSLSTCGTNPSSLSLLSDRQSVVDHSCESPSDDIHGWISAGDYDADLSASVTKSSSLATIENCPRFYHQSPSFTATIPNLANSDVHPDRGKELCNINTRNDQPNERQHTYAVEVSDLNNQSRNDKLTTKTTENLDQVTLQPFHLDTVTEANKMDMSEIAEHPFQLETPVNSRSLPHSNLDDSCKSNYTLKTNLHVTDIDRLSTDEQLHKPPIKKLHHDKYTYNEQADAIKKNVIQPTYTYHQRCASNLFALRQEGGKKKSPPIWTTELDSVFSSIQQARQQRTIDSQPNIQSPCPRSNYKNLEKIVEEGNHSQAFIGQRSILMDDISCRTSDGNSSNTSQQRVDNYYEQDKDRKYQTPQGLSVRERVSLMVLNWSDCDDVCTFVNICY